MLVFDESQSAADEASCTLVLVARDERRGAVACRVPYPVLLRLCARAGVRRRSAIDAYRSFARILHAALDARWERRQTEPDGSLLLLLEDIEEPMLARRIGTPYGRGTTGFPVDRQRVREAPGWVAHRVPQPTT